MLRGDLKIIYDTVEDSEKNKWSELAGYKSREGLYNYLRMNHDRHAYQRIVDALVKVIGEAEFNRRVQQINNSKQLDIDECRRNLIRCILSLDNPDIINNIKNDIIEACNNQVTRLEIKSTVEN